jgi:hypothetical protein
MSKIWFDGQYGMLNFKAADFRGTVYWASHGEGYVAVFNGWTLKKKFSSVDEAKRAVENLARAKATQLLNLLDSSTPAEQ